MIRKKNIIAAEDGFTLVESIVAMAIVVGVLIGTLMIMGRMAASTKTRDRLIAFSMAVEEMENQIAFRKQCSEKRRIQWDHRFWDVERSIVSSMGLMEIEVKVYKQGNERPLVKFTRLMRDYEPKK
ncbi:type II secretion system protein [bacterium]|nr:type II secretion system protein [bacterium]